MRVRDYDAKGGAVTLAVPAGASQLYSATGWIDWRTTAAYLSVRNIKNNGADALVRADVQGLTIRGDIDGATASTAPDRGALAMPAVPAPSGGWKRVSWVSRIDSGGQPDFDLILDEMLALAAPRSDNPAELKVYASRLRTDTVDGTPVTVYEIRQAAEANVPPGYGRLRYWVDSTGLIRRLELRCRTGAYAYLTFTPGAVPPLPNPVPAKS
jgi:hypothetical protein